MAYQKHRWVNKEIIKADQLNHIEDGIYNEEQRATQAEELIGQSVTNENTRATQAEGALGNRVTATESAITTLNGNDQVVGSVDYKISQAMSSMGGYKIVADHTAIVNPSDKYIYLEPDLSSTATDIFSEWIWIDLETPGVFEWYCTGEKSLDLSDYIKNTDFATTTTPGIVIVDGTTITIQNGVITANVAGGVTSFNGRTGAVTPQSGDYSYSDISNTPTLGTASSLDVASSGDASSTQIVKGDDSRLTDSRTPTSHTHTTSDITNFPTLGTAAALDVPATGNASSSQVVKGDDSRLSDSRTPTSHTHTTSDITNFPTIPGGVKSGTTRAGATDTTLYFIRS